MKAFPVFANRIFHSADRAGELVQTERRTLSAQPCCQNHAQATLPLRARGLCSLLWTKWYQRLPGIQGHSVQRKREGMNKQSQSERERNRCWNVKRELVGVRRDDDARPWKGKTAIMSEVIAPSLHHPPHSALHGYTGANVCLNCNNWASTTVLPERWMEGSGNNAALLSFTSVHQLTLVFPHCLYCVFVCLLPASGGWVGLFKGIWGFAVLLFLAGSNTEFWPEFVSPFFLIHRKVRSVTTHTHTHTLA